MTIFEFAQELPSAAFYSALSTSVKPLYGAGEMTRLRTPKILLGALCLFATGAVADLLMVRGTAVVGYPLAAVSEDLKKEFGIEFKVVTEGGSAAGIAGVGAEVVDIGLSTRTISGEERAAFPDKRFIETKIGAQAVFVVVPEEIWQAGVRRLSRKQLVAIYERRVKNWKELGGPDRDIVFYNRPGGFSGRGVWDVFVIWLYEDVRKAPLSKADVLETPDEVRDTVEFNGGAISLLEAGEMPKAGLKAIPLELDNGNLVEPTNANIASGKYPLSRPLLIVTTGKATGLIKKLLEYMVGEKGQAAVEKAGHVPLAKLTE
jgi:phosphate transport system substrate-binding protein